MAKIVTFRRARRDRVIDPLEITGVDVLLGSERALVELTFRALIGDRTLGAIERRAVGLALQEILADFRADFLQEETDIGEDWIVALETMDRLDHVPHADGGERDAEQRQNRKDDAEIFERNERRRQAEHHRTDSGCHDAAITHDLLPGGQVRQTPA